MKAISTQVRVTSLVLAVVMSTVVLGSTVVGLQATNAADPSVVVLDKITIKPSAVN